MKFDCIVSNAPYDNGLHEKFESKYFDICDGQIVWVSPLSFLLGKKQNKRITLELDKYKTDIEQINGNEYFDAAIGGTMGIVFCDMADEHNEHYVKFDGKQYNKCDEISTISNDELLNEFKRIITPLYTHDNLFTHLKYVPGNTVHGLGMKEHTENNPDPNWYIVRITRFSDRFTLYSNKSYIDLYKNLISKKVARGKSEKRFLDFYFAFNNKKTAENCINYLKTFFARGSYYIVQTGIELFMSGEFRFIPWFDFSDSMFNGTPEEIDIALFKKYHISQNIVNHIIEILPNYYKLDLSKYIL